MWNFNCICELPAANLSKCFHCATDEACYTHTYAATHTHTHIRSQIVSSEAVRELLIYIYHRLSERVLVKMHHVTRRLLPSVVWQYD